MVRKIKTSGRLKVREPVVRGRFFRRRRPLRERIGYFFVVLARLALIAVVLVCLGFLVKSFHYFIFRSGYFNLAEVKVEGVSPELEKQVRLLAGVRPEDQVNLLSLRTRDVASRIAAYPRIRNVRVTKQYPRTLNIFAQERKPVAIVNAEKMYLIDDEGVVLEHISLKQAKAYGLPFITGVSQYRMKIGRPIGERGVLNCLDFIGALKQANSQLYHALAEVNVNEREELTAYFERGTEVRLGKGSVIEKLPELEAFIQKMGSLAKVQYADFRFNRQIVYKPAIK
jgi:cell division septal protein FtsQ